MARLIQSQEEYFKALWSGGRVLHRYDESFNKENLERHVIIYRKNAITDVSSKIRIVYCRINVKKNIMKIGDVIEIIKTRRDKSERTYWVVIDYPHRHKKRFVYHVCKIG